MHCVSDAASLHVGEYEVLVVVTISTVVVALVSTVVVLVSTVVVTSSDEVGAVKSVVKPSLTASSCVVDGAPKTVAAVTEE